MCCTRSPSPKRQSLDVSRRRWAMWWWTSADRTDFRRTGFDFLLERPPVAFYRRARIGPSGVGAPLVAAGRADSRKRGELAGAAPAVDSRRRSFRKEAGARREGDLPVRRRCVRQSPFLRLESSEHTMSRPGRPHRGGSLFRPEAACIGRDSRPAPYGAILSGSCRTAYCCAACRVWKPLARRKNAFPPSR